MASSIQYNILKSYHEKQRTPTMATIFAISHLKPNKTNNSDQWRGCAISACIFFNHFLLFNAGLFELDHMVAAGDAAMWDGCVFPNSAGPIIIWNGIRSCPIKVNCRSQRSLQWPHRGASIFPLRMIEF